MKLDIYLKKMCINRNEFCKKVGVSYPTISNLMKGIGDPHLSIAMRIEEITEGKVTCKDLVNQNSLKNLQIRSKILQKAAE